MSGTRSVTNAASFSAAADDVFARIANRYDVLCDLFSFGIHRLWKRRVARAIAAEPWKVLLDGGTGTGDIVARMLDLGIGDGRQILATDLSSAMLSIARRKLAGYQSLVRFEVMNAHALTSITGQSIDAYSLSLVLKICDRRAVLDEAFRILRPGGRLVILEASNIPWRWLHELYLFYMSIVMPLIGWLATGGDTSAYKYLLSGVREFPSAERLATELQAQGFVDISYQRFSLGIVAIHTARKP